MLTKRLQVGQWQGKEGSLPRHSLNEDPGARKVWDVQGHAFESKSVALKACASSIPHGKSNDDTMQKWQSSLQDDRKRGNTFYKKNQGKCAREICHFYLLLKGGEDSDSQKLHF